MNRLEAGILEKTTQWSKEAGLNAARLLAKGAKTEQITYPSGKVMVKVSGQNWQTEITPKQYHYLVKWNNQIGPNFPLN